MKFALAILIGLALVLAWAKVAPFFSVPSDEKVAYRHCIEYEIDRPLEDVAFVVSEGLRPATLKPEMWPDFSEVKVVSYRTGVTQLETTVNGVPWGCLISKKAGPVTAWGDF